MEEHEQIAAIIEAKNNAPLDLSLERCALLVIDMQRYFTQPGHPFTDVFDKLSPGAASGYLERVREVVVPNIRALLERFRAGGAPVVFTAVGTEQGEGRDLPFWLRSFDELGLATLGSRIWPAVDDPSWQIDEALAPGPGELVLNKLSAGTFATTGLEQWLRHQAIDAVVVTGVSSDVCVATTAREAADRGFRTVVASDACTTLSASMHRASLQTFNMAQGFVRSTDQLLALLRAEPERAQ